MSDWAVGDLAVCIKSGDRTREGCSYTVIEVWMPGAFRDKGPNPYSYALLSFAELGISWWTGSDERRFRKILPDKHEQCEPEFITLLKRSKVTASDWLIRVGPLAKRLNEESRHDGDGA